MIALLLICAGLGMLIGDCADLNVTGLAVAGAVTIALGWWLNQALGRARRHLAALDETVAELNAEASSLESGRA